MWWLGAHGPQAVGKGIIGPCGSAVPLGVCGNLASVVCCRASVPFAPIIAALFGSSKRFGPLAPGTLTTNAPMICKVYFPIGKDLALFGGEAPASPCGAALRRFLGHLGWWPDPPVGWVLSFRFASRKGVRRECWTCQRERWFTPWAWRSHPVYGGCFDA